MHASAPDTTTETMYAMGFARHGAAQAPRLYALPIPGPGPGQLLVRLHAAGVGRWDLLERDGAFARRLGRPTRFPLVAGSEGAGVVVAVGAGVDGFREGDRVYGLVAHRNPGAGCHAEFALFDQAAAWPVPPTLSMDQAAVLAVDGAVALRGLRHALAAQPGERLMVFGASGGVGHLALQLARGMGLRTLAIASGDDGVRLARRLAADQAIDGRRPGFERAAARFASGGALALLTAGGEDAARLVAAMPPRSRIAWPHGVPVDADARADLQVAAYGACFDPATMQALHALTGRGGLVPHVSRRFPLERLAAALDAVTGHHLGRIAVLTR